MTKEVILHIYNISKSGVCSFSVALLKHSKSLPKLQLKWCIWTVSAFWINFLHLVCVQVSLLSLWKCSFESFKCHTHVARLEWFYNVQTILVHLDCLKKNPVWYVCVCKILCLWDESKRKQITVAKYCNSQALQVLWRQLFIQWDRENDLCTAHILHTYWCFVIECLQPFVLTFHNNCIVVRLIANVVQLQVTVV
jgi:hypothetical protein